MLDYSIIYLLILIYITKRFKYDEFNYNEINLFYFSIVNGSEKG